MTDRDDRKKSFKIIQGGRSLSLFLGGIPATVAPMDAHPFPIDGIVIEEDRFLVMSSPTDFEPATEHPLHIINRAWDQEPIPVGTIRTRAGEPYRYLAIIHDLDRSPPTRAIWILAALAALKVEIQSHTHVRSLAIPLLGLRHGSLHIEESLGLMHQAMDSERWDIDRIWLQVDKQDLPIVQALLEQVG